MGVRAARRHRRGPGRSRGVVRGLVAELHAEISTGRAQFERQIKQTKTITTARILDGALTALNPRAGTASIIVAVQITVTPASGPPVTKQSRLAGTLTKTSSGWKLSALGQVPVGAAASASGKGSGGG